MDMPKRFWCVADGVPVREEPGRAVKFMTLAKYSIVEMLEMTLSGSPPSGFYKIRFVHSEKNLTEGWAYAGYFEPYRDAFRTNVLHIHNATRSLHDAEQYLVWRGKVQYNLCGFFCAAYCADWDADIEDMLEILVDKKPALMQRVFPGWQGRGTSDYDLDMMLSALDFEAPTVKIGAALYDRLAGRTMLTPGRMQTILESHRVIYSVKIDKRSGRLARSGVLHWVALNDIVPNEFGGVVELYNPFGNKLEGYEWEQLVESGGVPYGVLVPRR
jgi:hypothetical protein